MGCTHPKDAKLERTENIRQYAVELREQGHTCVTFSLDYRLNMSWCGHDVCMDNIG